jgi:HEAT repeat protein
MFAGVGSSLKMRGLVVGPVVLAVVVGVCLWCFCGRGENPTELLNSPQHPQRVQGIDVLSKKTDSQSQQKLVEMCSDRDARMAALAVWALGQRHDADRRQTMQNLLHDTAKHPEVRAAAAEYLGKEPEADPQELMAALTGERDSKVRAGAARGLYSMRRLVTIPALLKGLEDPDDTVRYYCITALNRMMMRRFAYDPKLAPQGQADVIGQIRDYVRKNKGMS